MSIESLLAVAVASMVGSCIGCVAGLYMGVRVMVEPLKVALKELEQSDADVLIDAALRRKSDAAR